MLRLQNITKEYVAGDETVVALAGVSLCFRKSEFVSILGPSGCGKTTMLNIVGGLDRYTDGDLVIGGRSTKEYNDADWDAYRNHSIGFVFQNYNLIPHQTVLANVELALTLSGVSKAERRRRAAEALEKVGLGNQLKKKPMQMSGGQMQRVAIARALVNDPEILLADEPTGALDTQTSVAIMDLLREVAKDRLVIMVTHNPELAEAYSTRIVRLRDGQVTDDSMPYSEEEEKAEYAAAAVGTSATAEPETEAVKSEAKPKKEKKQAPKHTKMSFFTAFSLSLNNLMTKKARTILTSFAGSIGIIGIALILSMSNGITNFINRVQEDTLSTYPLAIQKETADYSAMVSAMTEASKEADTERTLDRIYVDDSMGTMLAAMTATKQNDITAFRDHVEANRDTLDDYVTAIQYTYNYKLQVYSADGKTRVSPTTIFDHMGTEFSYISDMMNSYGGLSTFSEMIDNEELLRQQYDLLEGEWPTEPTDVVLVVDKKNTVSAMTLYILGLEDQEEIAEKIKAILTESKYESKVKTEYSYDDFIGMEFYMLLQADSFTEAGGTYTVDGKTYPRWGERFADVEEAGAYAVANGTKLRISGIIRPAKAAVATSIDGAIGYTKGLTDLILAKTAESAIINQQKETPDYNVFTAAKFEKTVYTKDNIMDLVSTLDTTTKSMLYSYLQQSIDAMMEENLKEVPEAMRPAKGSELWPIVGDDTLPGIIAAMDEASFTQFSTSLQTMAPSSDETLDTNLTKLGAIEKATPTSINFYAKDFESKDRIEDFIADYNEGKEENDQISYTDLVGVLMSSVTTIIDVISYVLIGFVSVSLVVSSIMIGIITYISVLERTKEIGILRSIGASKHDISRVFNAETLIVGLGAGLIGVLATALLCIPVNIIIAALSGVTGVRAVLPWLAAIVLVLISMALTLIAGFIPAKLAAKKDPVVALRTE